MNAIVIMPVYNDWQAASLLCAQISRHLEQQDAHTADIILIDDGSSLEVDGQQFAGCCGSHVGRISLLSLGRNLGHQRAIAIGITYIQQNLLCDAVVVMDADGEDRAEDVPVLLDALQANGNSPIVFAERGRRVEGVIFKTGYLFYRLLHRFATGRGIRVGNFSAIPAARLHTLVVLSELWNHYAAAVLKARIPHTSIVVNRGARLHGRSKMNFVSLVIHGLSALVAHHELVGTRIFVSLSALTAILVSILVAAAALWSQGGLAVPIWQLIATATLVLLAGQMLAISFGLVFFIMISRTNQGFLPVRDYSYFVHTFEILQQQQRPAVTLRAAL